jgi:hypothetical protein
MMCRLAAWFGFNYGYMGDFCSSCPFLTLLYNVAPNTRPVDTSRPATTASGITWNPSPAALLDEEPPPDEPPPPLEADEVARAAVVAAVAVVRLLALLERAAKPMAVGLYRKTLRAIGCQSCSFNAADNTHE